MEQKLIRFLQDDQIILQNKKIIVAVSGGPDSVALLHFLKDRRSEWNIELLAVTIDHQLRSEAEEDIRYVRHLCEDWNIRLINEKINVGAYERLHKVSTQVAARQLRYALFAKVMEKENADYLALGHHADDQIETIVMSFMRTTNLAGLQGIPHTRPFACGHIIRPLLSVNKAEIEQYCREKQLIPRIDKSNEDISYMRNYVRKRIVPQLKEKNPNLHVTMQQLIESLREDEQYLQQEARNAFEKIARYSEENGKTLALDQTALRAYATPLQRRIYRLTLDYLYDELPSQLSYSHENIFLALLKGNPTNKSLDFPRRLVIEVGYGLIRFYFKKEKDCKEQAFKEQVHSIPTIVPLPSGHTLEVAYTNSPKSDEMPNEYICDLSQVTFPLQVRTRRPGDRMRYRGLPGSKKIKDIFIDEKIPRHNRDKVIVVTDATGEILWLVGIRKGVLTKRPDGKEQYLSITYKD